MTFTDLALVSAVGILGPLLALPKHWRLPVVLGELLAGILLGPTGTSSLHASNPSFTLLANIGFALVMFVAGSHVPVRDPVIIKSIRSGTMRALGIAAISIPAALAISHGFGTGHTALYAVLLSSSSAALVLPIIESLGITDNAVVSALPQIAVADAACIVALPLAIDPSRAGRAALGSLAVLACATVLFFVLRYVEQRGWRHHVHDVSEDHSFALELRISLAILFALAAVATKTHVSIMLAGFSFGLALAAVGEPRRLAKQLFAITEGFLGPLFFIWLGASLNLRDLGSHPEYIGLGVALGAGAVVTHVAMGVTRQPVKVGMLCAAQLGVPVAAATLGTQLHLLAPGQPAALILGALVTIAVATLSGVALAPPGEPQPQSPPLPQQPQRSPRT
ncbi:MAG TPA: cation:proton antiporter [Mycobacteriales bacterium]|nr:cation:proton antiporter [Mycobacteriales bacterium]